jgi:hypothetical protein
MLLVGGGKESSLLAFQREFTLRKRIECKAPVLFRDHPNSGGSIPGINQRNPSFPERRSIKGVHYQARDLEFPFRQSPPPRRSALRPHQPAAQEQPPNA